MLRFISLNVSHLRLDDIAGLISETIAIALLQTSSLGAVALAKLQTLSEKNDIFLNSLHQQRASELTIQINAKDKQRDSLFAEIKRVSRTGQQSSLPHIAAAGIKLVDFLTPFWDISREPMMSQTVQVRQVALRYGVDPMLASAAVTLGIDVQFQELFTANNDLQNLYDARLLEMAQIDGPSASSIKSDVVKAYNGFCIAVEITLSATPTEGLQLLFSEMNEIRRKYISHLPTVLDNAHTSVAPVAEQIYTGRHITPLPQVFYQPDSGELRELIFAEDFTVTYRNNVKVGEAKILIHGKGKYTGRYESVFHIIDKSGETV
jgi:hypothetical protein